MRSSLRIVAVISSVMLPLAPAAAQGWIEHPRYAVEKVRSAVQVNVIGRAAQVSVEEWFRNTGPRLEEGSYLYPLPGEAVFADFSLWQGDRELKGETMDAAQARSIYEDIVRRKRDPALIELAGHGLLRARVFPIAPGETRKITLRYTQMLDRVGDAWRFRYVGGTGPGVAASRSLRVQVDSADRFGEPYSPTHRITSSRSGDRRDIALADAGARGDFELFLPLARALVGMSLVGSQPVGEDGFFMLLLAPGSAAHTSMLRRDVVAVLDVSGSMSGDKLDQARSALAQLLGTLRANDRFRVIAFGSGVRRYAAGWTPASPDNVRAGEDWVRGLDADGGTNIAGALTEAFAEPPADGALGVVVFLTDGLPTVGETDPERIAAQAERDRGPFRVFAFGVGYDVNTYLLDRLTERARGVTAYIQPGGDIEQAVGALAAKLASPVLTDLALSADGVELYDLQPHSLPDLFGGDELVVFGRLRGEATGERSVTVTGRRSGREERFSTTVHVGGEQPGTDYIQQLWAARKAGALASEIRLHGPNGEIVSELKRLALRYGILTEYTSYLVQEPGFVAQRPDEIRPMAPRDQVGAGAVARSEAARKLASSYNLDAVTVTGAGTVEADSVSAAERGRTSRAQRLGGRVFVWRDSVWTDIAHSDSLPVVRVAAFSDAYFALLRALPELRQPATLEPAVLLAGRRVSIEIQAGGKTTWAAGELAALVRDFRS